MKKNVIPVFAALAIVALLGATMVAAYQGGFMGGMTDEEHAAVQSAIQNNDYVAWKSAIESTLTQENFQQIQTKYAQMQQNRADMTVQKTAIEAALNANDYNAWKTAMTMNGQTPKILDYVDADNFSLYKQMYDVMKSGDFTKAQELRTELGLPDGPGFGFEMGHGGRGMGFGKGRNMDVRVE
ncbi:MAG: hypothetical protein KKD18_01840 [Nanoarchaeota archaeon]|nr:hypothetical protein [Nanoarchaeota archaeon]MBU0977134.1 hypothetical protein [Nanoarchaeota archaeon]